MWPAADPQYSPSVASPGGDDPALVDMAISPRCRLEVVEEGCGAWDLGTEELRGHGMAS